MDGGTGSIFQKTQTKICNLHFSLMILVVLVGILYVVATSAMNVSGATRHAATTDDSD
jgi:hypothetical protein